jgi:hypothetical protein
MDKRVSTPASKNTLLTIILVLLILITAAMIFNFYGMKIQSDDSDIPQCVGSDDLNLNVNRGGVPRFANSGSANQRERVQELIRSKVKDYSDGSYNPEVMREMIVRAQQKKKVENNSEKPEPVQVENMTAQVAKSDKPENGVVKFCIYHMNGCGHCHDIMSIKQDNGMTKFEELQQVFKDKPNVQILDFQHGKDSEASKFRAFPVIMLVKDGSNIEYNRDRTVEGMARFITQNL